MPTYQRGSKGPEVTRIQERLKELGFYRGPNDGDFGGGTESAVRSFQKSKKIATDGIVGTNTWAKLFAQEPIPVPSVTQKPLSYRCLALTGAIETGAAIPDCFAGLSGDFDGQGMSFGVLQWNLGRESLQPLLREMLSKNPKLTKEIFIDHFAEFQAMLESSRDEQLAWVRSAQDLKRFAVNEPWRGLFKTLGRTEEFQAIQLKYSDKLFQNALALCRTYRLKSERAVALMFDIKVQNGGIGELVRSQIENEVAKLPKDTDWNAEEVGRMQIIANRRAEAAKAEWVEDVRARKLMIANGSGRVHGNNFDLQDQYGIRLSVADVI
jgi:hypothetical protein